MPNKQPIQIIVARPDGNQRALELSPLAYRVLVGLLEVSTDRLGMGSEPLGVTTADWDDAEAAIYPLVDALKELLDQPELSPAEQAMADGRRKAIYNIVKDLQTEALIKERNPETYENMVKAHGPRRTRSCTCGHSGTFAGGEHGPSCALSQPYQ